MPLLVDKEIHGYRIEGEEASFWNGKSLPSVTDVLRGIGFCDVSWYTEDARRRGSCVHRAAELWETVGLDEASVEEDHRGYFEAWKKFIQDTGWVSAQIEEAVWSPIYGYAGCLDRRGKYPQDKIETVIDIKTGGLPKWVHLQLGGYAEALPVLQRKHEAVTLCPDGTWKRKTFSTQEIDRGRRGFLAALTVFREMRELGIISE
jgi:hypothetical protein